MKIHTTKYTPLSELCRRILKLIKAVDTNPKLLFGTISYLMLVIVFAVTNL